MEDQPPTFAALGLATEFLQTLDQLGFTTPTAVQAAALPPALAGRDLVVRSATGSGKTAAFALPLLAKIHPWFFGVQVLVLCPTRELADQVAAEVRRLGRSRDHLKVVTLCGGVPLGPQAASLAHGAHVVVGTPGRVQDHLSRKTLVLDGLRALVFDEADRMLDMGFVDDMVAVARSCPANRQTLLFSATYPPQIAAVAGPFLKDPLVIEVQAPETVPDIEERFYRVTDGSRFDTLAAVLGRVGPVSCLVFVNTKVQGRAATEFLKARGFVAVELSGDLDQRDRDEALVLFAGRCVSVVVATDVASRGLDVKGLDAVVNLELSPDPEVYVHRIGRTGRAGAPGLAVTLVSPREEPLVARVSDFRGVSAPPWSSTDELGPDPGTRALPPRAMVKLLDGKKEKIRPGDVLGALTAAAGFARDQIGAIKVTEWGTWVAVDRTVVDAVLAALGTTPVKGRVRRAFRVGV
ncbi:MAG TPA: ATP-dependent RNA helicase DbpA [Spirochaetia bacterium]|nr:ATP-dependent RNA helicase DbpA [Spirochaetia bacterium]